MLFGPEKQDAVQVSSHGRYKLALAMVLQNRKPLAWHYAADAGQEIKSACLRETDVTVLPVGNGSLLPSVKRLRGGLSRGSETGRLGDGTILVVDSENMGCSRIQE